MSSPRHLTTTKFENNLKAYGAAALAAGVGVLAPRADAEIVYTPTSIGFYNSFRYLDINHDGIHDFRIRDNAASYTSVSAIGRGNNGVVADNVNYTPCALPLNGGDTIGPSRDFENRAYLAVYYLSTGCPLDWGPGHYLGLRFTINDETHYGWVRISVVNQGGYTSKVAIRGYAYETIPNKPIVAGQTHELEAPEQSLSDRKHFPGSLGQLALGSAGLTAKH